MVLIGIGRFGAGMPETAQITIALKYLPIGKHVTLLTDGRFSGVSTGACIGHISPDTMSGGPIGELRDGDITQVEIDTRNINGTITTNTNLSSRQADPYLAQHADFPADTQLWAALQEVSGGSWGGCVFDVNHYRGETARVADRPIIAGHSDVFLFRRDPKLRQAGSTPKHSRLATQVWNAGACDRFG